MWFVIYKDGKVQTERELEIWDNVPIDKKVSKIGFVMSDKLPPIVMPIGERYTILRTAKSTFNEQKITGYILLSTVGKSCYLLTIRRNAITFSFKKTHTLKIREEAWRKGG